MRFLLAFFLLPVAALAAGGITAVPPFPTTVGAEYMSDVDMETLPGAWTLGACAAAATDFAHSGVQSVKVTGGCVALSQSFVHTATPWVEVTMYMRRTADWEGVVVTILKDVTDKQYFADSSVLYRPDRYGGSRSVGHDDITGPDGDFIELVASRAVEINRHGTHTLRMEVQINGYVSGELWLDDVSVKPLWHPLMNWLSYPNYRGYLWSGETSHLCSAADAICGFSEVRPPLGTTVAETHVDVQLGSAPGCGSPIETVVVQPTVQRTNWQLDGSVLADDSTSYVCADLRLDSDDSLISTYPDWQLEKRTAAWRTANLTHWTDDYGRWMDGDTPRFTNSTYVRLASAQCAICVYTSPDGYKGMGFYESDALPKATPAGGGSQADYASLWSDIARAAKNDVVYFSPFSGADARSGNDQVGPYFDALDDLGLTHWNIMNHQHGNPTTQTLVPTDAPAAPGVSCVPTGGTISDPFVHAKVSSITGRNTLENFLRISETAASPNAFASLSGSTNTCTVTPPACQHAELGFWVYAVGSTGSAEPAMTAYSLQTSRFVACGGSLDLTQLIDSKRQYKTDSTAEPGSVDAGRVSGSSTETDAVVWQRYIDRGAGKHSFKGLYLGDEVIGQDAPRNFAMAKYFRENAPAIMGFSLPQQVRSLSGTDYFYSAIVDINGQDLYYASQLLPDDSWSGHDGRPADCYTLTPGQNVLASYPNMGLPKVDLWVDDKARFTAGSRPIFPILMQWGRTSTACYGWTYDEHRKQMWKAIIAMQNWGTLGIGVGTWGWVTTSGMDRMANPPRGGASNPVGNTETLAHDIRVGQEIMEIEAVLLEPVADSTQLGFGTVLANQPTATITLPTGTCTGYTDPVRALAKQMATGDQWILLTSLCRDSFDITVTLANLPAGAVVVGYPDGGRQVVAANQFTFSTSDFGVHIFRVFTPAGSRTRASGVAAIQ